MGSKSGVAQVRNNTGVKQVLRHIKIENIGV